MKLKTLQKRAEILKRYTPNDLANLFVKRLDDELFASVGAIELTVAEQRSSEPHLIVWKGWDLITDSRYLT